MIETEEMRLVPFEEAHFPAMRDGDTVQLSRLLQSAMPENWSDFETAKAIGASYEAFKTFNSDPPWTGYFIILKSENKLIGTCGYKGKPDNSHCVEIGYEIDAPYRRRGLATQAAKGLIDLAFSQNVLGVKAHTLAEENASVNVLRKCNFTFTGEVNDPADGKLWSWFLEKK